MNGGEALVRTLVKHGVELAFNVPGESYLTILEELRQQRDRIKLVLTRHESTTTFAADAYGKVTGKPAAAFVTRGPGATNASIGLHTAKQDSTPLVLFIGHVPTREMGREAFQEIDYPTAFGPLTKAVIEVLRPEDCAAAAADALAIAVDGRPGPVAVVLPEDVTESEAGEVALPGPSPRPSHQPDADAIAKAGRLIEGAQHPIIIGGELIGLESAHAAFADFAERIGAGVTCTFRRQDILPQDHPANLGHFGLTLASYQWDYWKECDLVIIAGARPDGVSIQDYTLLRDDQTVIHIYPEAEAFTQTAPTVALDSDLLPALKALGDALNGVDSNERLAWRANHHEAHAKFMTPGLDPQAQCLGDVDMAEITRILGERLPEESTIVNDSGAFASWLHRHYPYRAPYSQLAACLGAMGYGMPGALGAKLARPDVPVVAMIGDGGFLMTGQEIVTAVQQKLPIVVIVCDNGFYGSIATHQYRRGGLDALYGTVMNSPDFAALGRAYGAEAWTVTETAGFAPALDEALALADGPGLIHLKTDMRNLNAAGPQMAE
jgi:acetolactate synthase-1/2/3 large subunit